MCTERGLQFDRQVALRWTCTLTVWVPAAWRWGARVCTHAGASATSSTLADVAIVFFFFCAATATAG